MVHRTYLPRDCLSLFTHKWQNESEAMKEQTTDTKRI